MRQLIEQPAGVGLVSRSDGAPVRPMRYSLSVYQDVYEDGMRGVFNIEGRVGVDAVEGISLAHEGAELTLALDDGRVLDFFLTNSDGRIANRSNRFKANAE